VRQLQSRIAGASAARNEGWHAAEAPLVLFIDDDILPTRQLVREHLVWHQRAPDAHFGVLGHVRWARELHVTPFMRWLEHGIQFDFPSITGTETDWGHFYTANVSVKRALVERVGGFDEHRLPYGYEDLDLALRMHDANGFRLLYNRAAEAEHVHPMDLEFWKQRVSRIAVSERQFVEMHPEFPPYFHRMFGGAAAERRARLQSDRLARWVPRWVPLLGPRVWRSAAALYRQSLAGPFLEAWEAADARAAQPSSASRPEASSAGSAPGGP
jgi:GT2 family glycosyltransferase